MNDDNRGSMVSVSAIVFTALSIFTMLLRGYVRAYMLRSFGFDDWVMLLTVVLFVIYSVFALLGVQAGIGRPISSLTLEAASTALKNWWFCTLFYSLSSTALKVAIGSFLLRVTKVEVQVYILWAAMALSVAFGTSFFFFYLFRCSPFAAFWDTTGAVGGTCIPTVYLTNMTYAHAAILCVVDCTFAIIPSFIVRGLQINRRSKAVVCFILTLGAA
ncbi:uncharacterized protein BP5553_07908 [Venustampulla echinocandica]|uniref:Rhodopsin domain-containing protein n=1 Tax=Venustampulla echinocandica TaxID=2656787 RepID=A0A370THW8_9HELO|nr:uncharacterized protein BP5553_07908 [Venustampulla echinocandica]RDL34780.1 hypothetical protein BP5553_07908 [Venustampulla echinocandica]